MADELTPITITVEDGFILGTLHCKHLDEPHAEDMQANVTQASAAQPGLAVVLDMSAVEFVPSLSLGALLGVLQAVKKNKARLLLAGAQEPIQQTLTICRLDKLFEIVNTLDDAKAKLNS